MDAEWEECWFIGVRIVKIHCYFPGVCHNFAGGIVFNDGEGPPGRPVFPLVSRFSSELLHPRTNIWVLDPLRLERQAFEQQCHPSVNIKVSSKMLLGYVSTDLVLNGFGDQALPGIVEGMSYKVIIALKMQLEGDATFYWKLGSLNVEHSHPSRAVLYKSVGVQHPCRFGDRRHTTCPQCALLYRQGRFKAVHKPA